MTNKKVLALLMTVSMAFQQAIIAEDVVTPKSEAAIIVDAAQELLDAPKEEVSQTATTVSDAISDAKEDVKDALVEATEEVKETAEEPTLSAAHVTALRVIYFLTFKNLVRYFLDDVVIVGKATAGNYVNHGFSYGADLALPYKNKDDVTTVMKIAEYLANEVTVVDKTGLNWRASGTPKWAGKTFFKALNRKQLFFPKTSEMHAFLASPQAHFVTAGLEGWDNNTSKDTIATDFVKGHMFGAIAQFANKMAKDIIAALVLSGKMPEALDKFTDSEANMKLVENVLAQVIEDMLLTAESKTIKFLP